MKLKCCSQSGCEVFYDDFERDELGDNWTVVSGGWSIVDDDPPSDHGRVLKESGTLDAILRPRYSPSEEDVVVGYGRGEIIGSDYGMWILWTGVPRIIVNYDRALGTYCHIDIHTGETTVFRMYQSGWFAGEHAINTAGMSGQWVLVRVAFGKKVDLDHKVTFSIGLCSADQQLAALCQVAGYWTCLTYDPGARYCALGNGGTDPVYFSEFAFANFHTPALLCGPCDCNCENHCVSFALTATFVKVSDSNPDCDDYDGASQELIQVGHDDSPETPCPNGASCRCWWRESTPFLIEFCGQAEYDIFEIALVRKNNTSLDGADLSDFALEIVSSHMGHMELPLIEIESTCKPLKLVFGPWTPEFFPVPSCCSWNVEITE